MSIIREYTQADLPRMMEIWNEVVRDGIAFPQEEELTLETAHDFFAAQTFTGVAELEDGSLGGLYILHPNNVGRCGHISNASYAVDSHLRGQHIGEALVTHCLKMGRQLGFRILQFNAVVSTNHAALALYKKLGFTQLGVIPGGFRMDGGKYEDIIPHYIVL